MTLQNPKAYEKFSSLHLLLAIFLLAAAIVAIYGQVQNFEFINLDDNYYVTLNRHVQNGLTYEDVKWAFTNIDAGQWIPLVWLSYMIDSRLCGLSPGWFHLVNVFFHIANAVLLFLLARKLSGGFWKSLGIAIIFAVHPLHVESVAWVTERKDVLSMFFLLLCVRFYVGYTETSRLKGYFISIMFFILGLMAKPMLVTLPFILLLLDHWPLGRFSAKKNQRNEATCFFQSRLSIIIEKIPYIAISIAICALTVISSKKSSGLIAADEISINSRIANALMSYAAYLIKMLWPSKLAVPYPYPDAFVWWEVLASTGLLLAITIYAIKNIRQKPYVIVGWLWYIVTLFPVIGLVQSGTQAMADRFVYVPVIGIYVIVVWSADDLIEKFSLPKPLTASIATLIICILSLVSYRQVQHWKNSVTLFTHATAVTKNNFIAYFNLGDALHSQGELSAAIANYGKALLIEPDDVNTRSHLGLALLRAGEFDTAIFHLKKAVSLKPDHIEALNNLGIACYKKGENQKAVFYFREALKIDPGHKHAKSNLKKLLDSIEKSSLHSPQQIIPPHEFPFKPR
jgi:protein O-mannosyl-transferase